MLAKRIALGFGIAIILPLLVHYGVSTLSPSSKDVEKHVSHNHSKHMQHTCEGRKVSEYEQEKTTEKLDIHQRRFEKHLFIVAVPIGIVAIIIGASIAIPGLGTGLMFGGIFTSIDGYASCWTTLPDWLRFLSLLLVFCVLVVVSIKKMGNPEPRG